MEAQLDFSWQPDNVVWKPNPPSYQGHQYYEMPVQLDFKNAEPPTLLSEQPAPMAFTNGAKRNLIQYAELPKKKPTKITEKPKNKPITSKKIPKVSNEPKPKPEWNSHVMTVGLFDPTISKKVPIEIKQAISKDNNYKMKKPEVFNDIHDIPVKNTNNAIGKKTKKNENKEKIEENLEIKFIADQEELVKKLEMQLESERLARKQLDAQFAQKLKEMERVSKVKVREIVPVKYGNTKKDQKIHFEEPPKPATIDNPPKFDLNFTASDIPRAYSSSGIRNDPKSRDIHEPPTHDISPMVLKAKKLENKSKPPPVKSTSKVTPPKPILKQPEKTSKSESMPIASSIQNKAEIKEITIQPSLIHKQSPIKFESYDIIPSDPILNSLGAAITRFKTADKYSNHAGINLISKVSSKYIAYYANELADMLVDDFLIDCVHDLQRIEDNNQKKIHKDFQNIAEENFEQILQDFNEETKKIQTKYITNKPSKFTGFKLNNDDDDYEKEIIIEDKKRDWEISFEDSTLISIRNYRKAFQDFQKVFSGGSDGKLWDVYSIIGDDILDEVIKAVADEYDNVLDEFTERIISQEFS